MFDVIKDYFLPYKLVLVPHEEVFDKYLLNVFSLPKNGKTFRFRNKKHLSKKISNLESLTMGVVYLSKPQWGEEWDCFKKGMTIGTTTYALFDRYGIRENHVIREDYQQYFKTEN